MTEVLFFFDTEDYVNEASTGYILYTFGYEVGSSDLCWLEEGSSIFGRAIILEGNGVGIGECRCAHQGRSSN